MKYGILLFITLLAIFVKTGYGVDFAFYCKCYCPPNSTIVKVKDCSVCNKNLCIEQKLCVFQNNTVATSTSSQRPRSFEDPKQTIMEEKSNIESSFVSYPEYLYALLLGRVKRDYMINNDEEDRSINVKKRRNGKSKNLDNEEKPTVDDDKEEQNIEDKKEYKANDTDVFNDNENEYESEKPEEEETVISIIETGTEDGYQKSEEENWMTECFKRGSLKDESIIVLFIGSTCILLVYAVMKKCFANNYEVISNRIL
ncbi:hypothetical protein LY90DRAFT_506487 [Neocallimastix californiae]|uniref:Membrane anchor Opy2 N-terminal domain-containing protein n=1 Tax=Neocallimastix californiae TaxID=1754190 RepID=A0A1Y2DE10_9FUNG|nr:hypothetical protein LY90DRAFT_506487 [Neocallimastix californiae]|eukprot:ORY57334.1 hypothetical protein LY90DRAFT_506487 [Neocallimastix californiae]